MCGSACAQVRELFREKDAQSKWEKYTAGETGTDVYFQYAVFFGRLY